MQFSELSALVAAGHTLSHQATHIIDTINEAKMKCNSYSTSSSPSSPSSPSSTKMNGNNNDGENQVEVEVEVEVVQEDKELSDVERVQMIQSVFSQWNLLTHGLRPQIAPLLTRIQEQRLTQNENLNGTNTLLLITFTRSTLHHLSISTFFLIYLSIFTLSSVTITFSCTYCTSFNLLASFFFLLFFLSNF